MNEIAPQPPPSPAETQLVRQVELFTDAIATSLGMAEGMIGSRKDKDGFDRRREIEHAMGVAVVCAEIATALARLRGTSLDINVRRLADGEPQYRNPPPIEG